MTTRRPLSRRSLVLVDEAARHPFLKRLPPHIRHGEGQIGNERPLWRFSMQEVREFLMAYCACFLAVTAFIY